MDIPVEQSPHRLAVLERDVHHAEQGVNLIGAPLFQEAVYLILIVGYALVMQEFLLLLRSPRVIIIGLGGGAEVAQVLRVLVNGVRYVVPGVHVLERRRRLVEYRPVLLRVLHHVEQVMPLRGLVGIDEQSGIRAAAEVFRGVTPDTSHDGDHHLIVH